MENKLQELTRKLYDAGLENGRHDADAVVPGARKEDGENKISPSKNVQFVLKTCIFLIRVSIKKF